MLTLPQPTHAHRAPPHQTLYFPFPLSSTAYNYEPYTPRPGPSIHPWPRSKLHMQTISPAPPIFLSCHLSNPVHLASILAHGCEWSVVQCVAGGMTPAVLKLRGRDGVESRGDGAKNRGDGEVDKGEQTDGMTVNGVLLGGLRDEVRVLLESTLRRRYGDGYQRVVEEIEVRVEDGGAVVVPAYVYRGR